MASSSQASNSIPSGYLLCFSNLHLFLGIDAIVKRQFYYQKYGFYYFHETGTNAVIVGIILFLSGIYFFYRYHKGKKEMLLRLARNIRWVPLVYVCWLWFAAIPLVDNFLFGLNVVILIGSTMLNLILSIKFHFTLKGELKATV